MSEQEKIEKLKLFSLDEVVYFLIHGEHKKANP